MKDNFFTLYPAIDIKDGKCVRLLFGEMEKETVYNNNPLDQALWFCRSRERSGWHIC
jgi:Phosphoribosylformimino-5-aminoimidazole carboxamide ribonucleotide (ProFAR) isomerase